MNGIHDMGGMHNFGPVESEANGPVFHEDWERQTFGLWILCYGAMGFSEDESRNAIEHTPPAEYLWTSYYEHVLSGLERLGVEKGVFTEDAAVVRRSTDLTPFFAPSAARGCRPSEFIHSR